MKLQEKPRVSIVISVKNVEKFIEEALSSILKEEEISLEVILVDNGCSDSTIPLVQQIGDPRVKILPGPKTSISAALNVAYSAISGDIVMRCDGDDFYPPQRISEQVAWLDQHPDFGAVCGTYSMIDERGNMVFDRYYEADNAEEVTQHLRNRYTPSHVCAYAVRTDVLQAMGGSREYFNNYEDIDFLLRLGEFCRVWYLPNVHYFYRLNSTSMTHTRKQAEQDFFHEVAFEFQRQRLCRGKDDLELHHPPEVPKFENGFINKALNQTQEVLLGSAWSYHQRGQKRQSFVVGLRALLIRPTNITAWKSLVALLIKKPVGKGAFSLTYQPDCIDQKYFAPMNKNDLETTDSESTI